jgi:uncharacterized membrane protein YvbJ
MQDIDYDNLFIYMSLIFAISIFIILLFGCAFSNGKSQPNILENFFGEEDIKKKILDILRKNEKEIKNKEEIFIFKGYITDSLVVNEQYIIKADECHINYVSGKKEINL